MVECSTCLGVRSAPPTWVGSADAGGSRPERAGVVSGSRAFGSTPCGPPVLPEWLERSFVGRREGFAFWVRCWSSEVGREVCCSLDQAEASGGLLEVR